MQVYGQSATGLREENQDSFLVLTRADCFLMAVADGMGGHAAGQLASRTTIQVCRDIFREFGDNPSEGFLKYFINKIISTSQSKIREIAESHSEYQGMGTTLTIVLGYQDKYAVGNIGDSRTYKLGKDNIRQLTSDHSYISDYKQKHPHKPVPQEIQENYGHYLTRCIDGSNDNGEVFPKGDALFELESQTALLLCSDGMLIGRYLDNNEAILKTVLNHNKPELVLTNLISLALDQGSTDNITVVFGATDDWFRQPELRHQKTVKIQQSSNRSIFIKFSKAAAVIALVIVVISIKYPARKNPEWSPVLTDSISSIDQLENPILIKYLTNKSAHLRAFLLEMNRDSSFKKKLDTLWQTKIDSNSMKIHRDSLYQWATSLTDTFEIMAIATSPKDSSSYKVLFTFPDTNQVYNDSTEKIHKSK